jgi:hypothetical protein
MTRRANLLVDANSRRCGAATDPRDTACPEWLDLFLRAARSPAMDGWYFTPSPCWSCGPSGWVIAIDLYPIGQVFGAQLCLGCHSLRISICDRVLGGSDWDDIKQDVEHELSFLDCDGDERWDSNSAAVLALRRVVIEAERAEQHGWKRAWRHITLVTSDA